MRLAVCSVTHKHCYHGMQQSLHFIFCVSIETVFCNGGLVHSVHVVTSSERNTDHAVCVNPFL